MKYRYYGDRLLVRLDRGEEVTASLLSLAEKENIALASVQGIGAADQACLGVYDLKERVFRPNDFSGVYEITSLLGSIDRLNGKPRLHLHMNIADSEGRAYGGHLNSARISITCEIMLILLPGTAERFLDEETGIYIWDLD